MRWLGTVPYREALRPPARPVRARRGDDWLLLLEHPHVYTLGARADMANVLVPPESVGAELVRADRGGDVTYHGPGQLVGYPILTVPGKRGGGMADTVAYVRSVEQLVIDTLADLGLPDAGRLRDYPGVWVAPGSERPRKIAAIGVRLTRGRSMHGFALNVAPDMTMFGHIVPCGIADKAVTSLGRGGHRRLDARGRRRARRRAVRRWAAGAGRGSGPTSCGATASAPTPTSRRSAGASGPAPRSAPPATTGSRPARLPSRSRPRSPSPVRRCACAVAWPRPASPTGWPSPPASPSGCGPACRSGPEPLELKRTVRDLGLVTVCEEAGCPNLSECWSDGTATFMINGERCTRACGFCLVDTRHPEALDPTEPAAGGRGGGPQMGLGFAVVTTVARDDLPDEGAGAMAATIEAIRRRTPGVQVEVLISDCRGRADALDTIFAARPDVLNHNVETVPRLQRAVRPSAGYARSLAVLARARAAGLTTKSGLVVGMGETDDEILATLADLAGIGVEIVTIGQYLRPTSHHLPVARWVTPEQFDAYRVAGEAMGIAHVESSPLTRSSYHARQAAAATDAAGAVGHGSLRRLLSRQSGVGPVGAPGRLAAWQRSSTPSTTIWPLGSSPSPCSSWPPRPPAPTVT